MSAAIDIGLRAVLTAADGWIAGHGLTAGPLPAELAELRGALGEATLQLTTRRFHGGGFASLTVAAITDAQGLLRSVTLIGLPTPASLGPVLGVDLIGFGGALSLVAVDLSPTDVRAWEEHAAAPLSRLHAAVEGRVVARKWPGFAHEVFSPRAVIAGVRRGEEEPVLAAIAAFVAALPVLCEVGDAARARHTATRSLAWRRAELANRREHDALTRIFGGERAGAYLELLFGGSLAEQADQRLEAERAAQDGVGGVQRGQAALVDEHDRPQVGAARQDP